MAYNMFVGGLPYETSQVDLTKLFAPFGAVKSVKLIMDRETGRSKGFGFVEMSSEHEMRAAIAKLNGAMLGARAIFVNEARPQEKREGGFTAKPGFIERRSGKDRRAQPGAGGFGEKKPWEKKPWDKKPGGFGDKKPWEKKPWDKKPAGAGDKKPWEKKAWDKKPGGFADKKPWAKKPWDKMSPGKKKFEGKPKSFGGRPKGDRGF